MVKYKDALEVINKRQTWNDENEFLIDVLFSSSLKLLVKCYEEIENGNTIIAVPPLLRQVQENIVVLLGMITKTYSIEEFIENNLKPKTIMNRIKQANEGEDLEGHTKLNTFLHELKKMLNKYSHTSYDGAMSMFTDNYHTFESRQFNRSSMLIIIYLIEAPFLALFNKYYDESLELPNPRVLQNEFKQIKTLKYATKNMPKSVKKFIEDSEYLSNYYKDMSNEFKNKIDEIRELNENE